jgi:hypothetical protein
MHGQDLKLAWLKMGEGKGDRKCPDNVHILER